MPIMDGFELYEQIKKMDDKIKVVFVTASEVNYEILREVFSPANVELNYDEDIIRGYNSLGDSREEQGVLFSTPRNYHCSSIGCK